MIKFERRTTSLLAVAICAIFSFCKAQIYQANTVQKITDFQWPEGKQMAIIESICQYASDTANGIWIDNIHNIASYIKERRGEKPFTEIPVYKNPLFSTKQRVDDLISRMTLEEKIGQMNMPCVYVKELGSDVQKKTEACRKFTEGVYEKGIGPGGGFFVLANTILLNGPRQQSEYHNELQKIAIENTLLGIPLIQFEEGTHGLHCSGGTIFPEGLAIGSTWNLNLVKKIYSAAASEARAVGIHALFTLVIEPNRDPRLGRNEEGYSEDPFLCSRIAESIVQGAQGSNVAASDKVIAGLCHYPGQSQPIGGLEKSAMDISERILREVFLPPWEAGIKKAGALGVMATYPAIDGVLVHSSEKILTKILREELGFKGLVLSEGDGFATFQWEKVAETQKEAGMLALKAGVDVGITYEPAYMIPLIENVKEGKVNVETINRSVRRILNMKFQLGLFEHPYVDPDYAVKMSHTKENQDLALQTAREGIVLLKNEKNLLPLRKNINSIAVIGPNADNGINQLGDYTSRVITQHITTILEGIKSKVSPKTKVTYVKGCNILTTDLNEIEKARKEAKNADIAVVVVGEGEDTNGEHWDVANLDLTGFQEELIKAVYNTGTPTIVVLINGRPLSIRWTSEHVPAIIEAWNCGEKGGDAVADILFGDINPSGRLAITFPRHSGQLPMYYNYYKSKENRIKQGYVDMSLTPLYEFGFGLSYTTFEYSNLQINPQKIGVAGDVKVSVDVKNTGSRKGSEVVQLYIEDAISSVVTPVKELQGFDKISLEPGEKKTISFLLAPEHLAFLDQNMHWIVEPGKFNIMVGSSSEDIRLNGEFEVEK